MVSGSGPVLEAPDPTFAWGSATTTTSLRGQQDKDTKAMISLTPSALQALRAALRETLRTMLRANAAIPDYWREKLGNKRFNDLTKDELLAACAALNVDVDRVISAPVAAGAPAPEAEAEDKAEDKAGQQDAADRAAELRTLAMARDRRARSQP
jgi:hypothetical protein